MSSEYSEELKKRAKEKLLEQFDLLLSEDYGRITINMNKRAKVIEIVPARYIKVREGENV